MFPTSYAPHIGAPIARRFTNPPRFVQVIGPTQEFASPSDYEGYVRVKSNVDAEMLRDKVQAAREMCEEYCGWTFSGRQYDMYFDFTGPYFADWNNSLLSVFFNVIEIPKRPMVSVQGIWLRDSAGNETQLDPTMYGVSQTRNPGRITIFTWPYMQVLDYPYIEQLRIRFTCGSLTLCSMAAVSPWTVTTQVPHGLTTMYNTVRFRPTGDGFAAGVLPSPLTARTDYYATSTGLKTFTIVDGAGNPVHFTDIGTGYQFVTLQNEGLPMSVNRAILSVASRDRFASDPRSLRTLDVETDMPKEARSLLKRYRRITVS